MVTPAEPLPNAREDACMITVDGRTYCIDPLEDAMHIISKRWAMLIIGVLGNFPAVRFGAAKRAIPGISARALSSVLTDLQQYGLAIREVDASSSPPAVSYRLTEAGTRLRDSLVPLIEWAEAHPADGEVASAGTDPH